MSGVTVFISYTTIPMSIGNWCSGRRDGIDTLLDQHVNGTPIEG